MINAVNGEVTFNDGLRFVPHDYPPSDAFCMHDSLGVDDWSRSDYGIRPSAYGDWQTVVVCGHGVVHLVLLSHEHSFYEASTPGDSERLVFHEQVALTELKGQRGFPWGEVVISLDETENRNWIAVVYSLGGHISGPGDPLLKYLYSMR